MGWDLFIIKVPIFGNLIEKNILARTTRTLGTLVASGVPILEALNITRETAGNAMFEQMYAKVYRGDPRGRGDRQADEGILRARLPSRWRRSSGSASSAGRSAC